MDIIHFGQNIAACRKERAMTQEQLAQELGITGQAVSKWENGQSYPDIQFLPKLADLFEVSLDELFDRQFQRPEEPAGEEPAEAQIRYNQLPWSDDPQTLHVVLFAGHKLVGNSLFHGHRKEKQQVEFCYEGPALNIQSDFSVACHERTVIQGSVTAGDSVSCGDVQGDVSAGDGVSCGNVTGNVKASDSVRCGNVGGSVEASDSVTCGDVQGDVRASDSVHCKAVYGYAHGSDGVHFTK